MRLVPISAKYAGVVEVFDDAVVNSPDIVRYLEMHGRWEEARVGAGEGIASDKRTNAVTFFDPFDLRCHDLLRGLAKTVWHYLDDYAHRHDTAFSGMEHVNVNRYYPGQFYHPHADDGPGHNRIISALVYLNDVTDGGATEFIYQGVSVSPRAGRLVIFPSNYAYAHAAHPPNSGVKYSAAFWTGRA